LNLEPAAHSAHHALLHMAPKWSSHRITRAGLVFLVFREKILTSFTDMHYV